MTNPFTLGARTVFSKGPGETQDNFTSLGDGEAKIVHVLDLSSGAPFHDVVIEPIKVKTGASGWTTGDSISLYLLMAENTSANFTDGIDETSNVDISASLVTAKPIATIDAEATSTTYYFDEIHLRNIIGASMPSYVAIVLANNAATAGADLSSTAGDHYARYCTLAYA